MWNGCFSARSRMWKNGWATKGAKCRAQWGMRQIPEACMTEWSAFLAERRSLSETDIKAELEAAQNAAPVTAPARK